MHTMAFCFGTLKPITNAAHKNNIYDAPRGNEGRVIMFMPVSVVVVMWLFITKSFCEPLNKF